MDAFNISEQEYQETITHAEDVIAKSKLRLDGVVVQAGNQEVVEAVIKLFGGSPINNGIATISYDMYCKVIDLLKTTGAYKLEEYV